MGRCVLREWVVRGGGLDGYLGEKGLPVCIQECLEGFHRDCGDHISWQFVPKWDSPNCGGKFATARTAPLLVELNEWSRSSLRVGCAIGGAMGNSRMDLIVKYLRLR